MLKTAYHAGIKLAFEEAGFSEEEIEKIAKFLWYKNVAAALPTFRKWLGAAPQMGHQVGGRGTLQGVRKTMAAAPTARTGVVDASRHAAKAPGNLPYSTGAKLPGGMGAPQTTGRSASDAISAARKRFGQPASPGYNVK